MQTSQQVEGMDAAREMRTVNGTVRVLRLIMQECLHASEVARAKCESLITTAVPHLLDPPDVFVLRLKRLGDAMRLQLNAILKEQRKTGAAEDTTAGDRVAVKGCVILLAFGNRMLAAPELNFTQEALVRAYPSFLHAKDDVEALTTYRNFMAAAVSVLGAENKKAMLMQLCAQLSEGRATKLVTGSGQKASVTRRALIYETEGGVERKKSRKGVVHVGDDLDLVSLA